MRFSPGFESSTCCKPSPDGGLVATLLNTKLILRSTISFEIVRTITISPEFASQVSFLRWSPPEKTSEGGTGPVRVLLADDDTVCAWDVRDPSWSVTINGAGGGIGRILNVEFGPNTDEILVFTDYGIKVTIWSLRTSRSIDIRDPKFTTKGYGFRPRTRQFALISRPAAHDLLTLHAATEYNVLISLTLPTVDAQGLRWSPCGRWIAIWDSVASGPKIHIYTADGHLYRSHSGSQDEEVRGLGIKSVEWSPLGDFLAIGDYEDRMSLLSGSTFTPTSFLDHPTTIDIPKTPVWQENVSSLGERSFAGASQPTCPPTVTTVPTDPIPKMGISTIAFDKPNGTLLATRCDNMPTTVWIWSLKLLTPCALVIHHSAVKSVEWHPTTPGLLLTQCVNQEGVIYLWREGWDAPQVVKTPLEKLVGKSRAVWIVDSKQPDSSSEPDPSSFSSDVAKRSPLFFLGDTMQYVLGHALIEELERPGSLEQTNASGVTEGSAERTEDQSVGPYMSAEKSVTDNAPQLFSRSSPSNTELFEDSVDVDVDDTFHYRKGDGTP
ncbi:MAG: hypothetical protein M1837_006987 [Sclerophora amabilis]|nr:MAG: hypothetical protein M1837_006987 [Sclerophora amabilis]